MAAIALGAVEAAATAHPQARFLWIGCLRGRIIKPRTDKTTGWETLFSSRTPQPQNISSVSLFIRSCIKKDKRSTPCLRRFPRPGDPVRRTLKSSESGRGIVCTMSAPHLSVSCGCASLCVSCLLSVSSANPSRFTLMQTLLDILMPLSPP